SAVAFVLCLPGKCPPFQWCQPVRFDGTLFPISCFAVGRSDRIQFPHQIENNRCKFEQAGDGTGGHIEIPFLYQWQSRLARLLHDKDVAGECS
ncbi:hypothetical protein, partial [Agrobacterium tumefaciens]|uniref:hypothetical protein n=1 Tax=Agrobacterium tumefaciens TaxID=358 RepID=UPI003B9F5B20